VNVACDCGSVFLCRHENTLCFPGLWMTSCFHCVESFVQVVLDLQNGVCNALLPSWHCSHCMRQGLCNDTVSVCPSVCASVWPVLRHIRGRAAGLLLWARRAGDFDCQRRTLDSSGVAARAAAQRSATNASSVTFAADVGGLVHTASLGLSLCLLCDHDHRGVVCRSDRRLGELFHARDGERDRGALCWAAEEPRSHVHRQNALMSPWAWLLTFTVQRVENVFHRRDHQCERL